MNEGRKWALSRIFLVSVLAAVIVVASALAVYFVIGSSQNNNKISVQALSIDSSTSNITATINVRNTSNLIRMGLFINNSFVGSYNYTRSEQWCFRIMNSWNNGTYSYYFTATPYSMPMMSRMGMEGAYWMSGRSYMITIIATFANGATYNATKFVTFNHQGMGSMMGSMMP